MLHLLLAVSLGFCNITRDGTYPQFTNEYQLMAANIDSIAPVENRNFALGHVRLIGDIDRSQRAQIYRACQYASSLYTVPSFSEQISLDIVVGSSSPPGSNVVGYWNGTVITLFTKSIDNEDLLFITTLHEIFHVFHFGDPTFKSLTTSDYVYTGERVARCTSNAKVMCKLYHLEDSPSILFMLTRKRSFFGRACPGRRAKSNCCTYVIGVHGLLGTALEKQRRSVFGRLYGAHSSFGRKCKS